MSVLYKTKNNNIFIKKDDDYDELDNELEEKSSQKSYSDIYDNFENRKNLPTNYGLKWSDDEKKTLLKMLKESVNEIDISKIALTLGRSEGGVKGEIKKIIITKYMNGENAEDIGKELNIIYKNVKSIIKLYLEKDVDMEINNLEKENKLLKLKMENIELRKNLKKMLE